MPASGGRSSRLRAQEVSMESLYEELEPLIDPGNPLTPSAIEEAEDRLGRPLPASLRSGLAGWRRSQAEGRKGKLRDEPPLSDRRGR